MKNKFLIPLISGLVTIGVFGCSNSPSEKMVGTWKSNETNNDKSIINCNYKFTFVKKSENLIIESSEFVMYSGMIEKATLIQNKDNPNVFTFTLCPQNIALTYYKDSDTIEVPGIPFVCPSTTLHRIK